MIFTNAILVISALLPATVLSLQHTEVQANIPPFKSSTNHSGLSLPRQMLARPLRRHHLPKRHLRLRGPSPRSRRPTSEIPTQ